MGKIQIEGMEFYAYHGFYKEERVIGNKYLLDIKFDVDFEAAALTDEIEGTVNYQEIHELTKAEMNIKSKLLEHVGGRIIASLKKHFDQISNIEVKISKLRPPLNGVVNKISVIING